MAGDGPSAAGPAAEATSRLCVKNLPKYLSDDRLKKHFAVKGEVTDVKVLKTRDGQPRQMGFVGYRTVEEAAAALKYFNNSFIDTSRLAVEFARPIRDAELPRPWSKHSDNSIVKQKQQQQEQQAATELKVKAAAGKKRKAPGAVAEEDAAADPKLAEFLSLMQPRSKARMWSNDDLLPSDAPVKVAPPAGAAKPGKRAAPDASTRAEDAAADTSRAAKRMALQQEHPQQQQQQEEEQQDEEEEAEEEEQGGSALMGKDALVMDTNVGDLDYLRSRMRKWDDDDDDIEEQQQQQQQHAERGGDVLMAAASDSDSDSDASTDEGGDFEDVDSDAEQQELEALRRGDQSGVGTSASQQARQQQQQQQQQQGTEDEDAEGSDEQEEHEDGTDDGGSPGQAHAGGPRSGRGDGGAADGVEDAILDTGRLFVRNLAYGATEADLTELFGRHGDLAEVHLVLDKDTKQSKGLAYVQFQVPEDALSARNALDSTIFQGRLLHILPARRSLAQEREARAASQQEQQWRQDSAAANASEGIHALSQAGAGDQSADGEQAEQAARKGPSFKSEREQQRKKEAGNRAAWNTLFMRADTVAAAVAAHYGVSKAELLDKSAADLPVRMALGEAQIIAQTKTALSEAGVAVDRLEAAAAASGHASGKASVARSASVLLVKNLPFTADDRELMALFGRHGTVVRLVLPPARALALVEYAEPQEARAAFKSLAYKKYQNVPLYLEWAPKDIFLEGAPATAKAAGPATASQPAAAAATAAASPAAVVAVTAAADEDADEDGPVATLFVKNLSFATTDEALAKHFDKAVSAAGGRLHSACVARRKASDGKLLSMGFGFVECDSEEVAKVVLKQLQGTKLDKHALNLQLSKRRAPTADKAAAAASKAATKDGTGTKLVVRNVAFEATKRDIMGLFGPFGHIKSCRLPKKFDGAHRGFAFIEFTTKQEAKAASEGLSGTHLYGRRLVVEYAEADAEGVDDMRAKTAQHAAKAKGGGDSAPAAAKRLQATL